MGTIHGESARSVYERVVHDMGIPEEAFLATDLVLTMGLSRPGGSSRIGAEAGRGGGVPQARTDEVEFDQLIQPRPRHRRPGR